MITKIEIQEEVILDLESMYTDGPIHIYSPSVEISLKRSSLAKTMEDVLKTVFTTGRTFYGKEEETEYTTVKTSTGYLFTKGIYQGSPFFILLEKDEKTLIYYMSSNPTDGVTNWNDWHACSDIHKQQFDQLRREVDSTVIQCSNFVFETELRQQLRYDPNCSKWIANYLKFFIPDIRGEITTTLNVSYTKNAIIGYESMGSGYRILAGLLFHLYQCKPGQTLILRPYIFPSLHPILVKSLYVELKKIATEKNINIILQESYENYGFKREV